MATTVVGGNISVNISQVLAAFKQVNDVAKNASEAVTSAFSKVAVDVNVSKLFGSIQQATDTAKNAPAKIQDAFKNTELSITIKTEIDTSRAKSDADSLRQTLSIQLKSIAVEVPVEWSFDSLEQEALAASKAITEIFLNSRAKFDTSTLSDGFSSLKKEANIAVEQHRNALAALIVTGQSGTAAFKKVENQLRESVAEAKKFDAALETVKKGIDSVNEKKISFGEQVKAGASDALKSGPLGDFISGNVAGLAKAGVEALGGAIQKSIELGAEFEKSLAKMSIASGLSGAGLKNLGDHALDLSERFGGSANAQLETFQGVLSRFGKQLAQTPDQLTKVTENVNTFAKASGLDAKGALETLGDSMLKFGVNVKDANSVAAESGRFMNVLAASAKVGSADIPNIAAAIKESGDAAKQAKVGFEESNAAIQVLAAGGKLGTDAGKELSGVLGKLSGQEAISPEGLAKLKSLGVNMSVVSDTSLPLSARLQELGKASSDATAFAQVFGEKNAEAAKILATGAGTVKDWTEQITGTDTATKQAATNMATFGETMAKIKATLERFGIAVFQTVQGAFAVLQGLVSTFSSVLEGPFKFVGGVVVYLGEALKTLAPLLLGGAIAWGVITAAQLLFNAAAAANPIGIVIAGLVAAVTAYEAFKGAATNAVKESLELAEAQKKNIEVQISDNEQKQKNVKNTQDLVKEYKELSAKSKLTADDQKRLQSITQQLDQQYPSLIDQTKSYKDNLQGVTEIGRQTTDSLSKLSAENEKLQKQMAESAKNIAANKRNLEIAKLRDVTSFDLIESKDVARFKERFIQVRQEFEKGLFTGKTEDEINKAQATILEFLNKYNLNAIDPNLYNEIYNSITASTQAAIANVKEFTGANRRAAQEAEELNKKQATAPKTTQNTTAKNPKASDGEDKVLKNLQQQIASAKELAKLEEEKQLIIFRNLAVQENRAVTKEEENAAAQKGLKILQEEYAKILEFAKVIKDEKGFVIGVGLKVKEENKPEVMKNLFDLGKLVSDTSYNLRIKTLVKGEDITKSVTDALAELKNTTTDIPVHLIATAEDVTALKADVQGKFADLTAKVTAKLNDSTDDEERKKLNEQLKKIAEEKARALSAIDKQAFDERKRQRDAEIQAIENANVRKLTLEIQSLEQQKAKELEAVRGNGAAILRITAEYDRQIAAKRDAIRQETDTLYSISVQLRTGLEKAFTAVVSAEERKRAKEKKQELDKQEDDLLKALKKGEISYQEYLERLSELDKQRAELDINTSAIDRIFGAINDSLSASLQGIADSLKASADAALQTAKDGYAARAELAKTAADLEKEIDEARVAGQIDREQELQDRLHKLRGNAGKTSVDLQKQVSDLQEKINIAHNEGRTDDEKKLRAELSDTQNQITGDTKKSGEAITKAYADIGAAAALSLGQAALEGKNFGDAAAQTAFDTLQSLVPIFVAQIFGSTFSALGPILGPIATAATTGILYGLVELARPNGAEHGAPEGITATYSKSKGATDTIPLWVAPREAIINARQSDEWRDTLIAINSGGDVLRSVVSNTDSSELAALMREKFSPAEIADMTGTDSSELAALMREKFSPAEIADMAGVNGGFLPISEMPRPMLTGVMARIDATAQNVAVIQDMTTEIKAVGKSVKAMHKDLSAQSRKPMEVIGGKLKTDGNSITATFDKLKKRTITRY